MKELKIRLDIFGVEPKIGDIIVFNPIHYKGLVHAECVGFASSGLPEVRHSRTKFIGYSNMNGNVTPKTGFVVYRNGEL